MAATGFTIPSLEDPHSPWPIAQRLLASHHELATLNSGLRSEWSIAFVMRYGDWDRNQRTTLGTCSMPTVSGAHKDLFDWMLERLLGYEPTFLITLNGEWWETAGDTRREILLFHEMLHAGQAHDKCGEPRFHRETGAPIPAIVGHDVEEFTAVVARYGAWKGDLAEFLQAAGRFTAGVKPEPVREPEPVDANDPPADAVF